MRETHLGDTLTLDVDQCRTPGTGGQYHLVCVVFSPIGSLDANAGRALVGEQRSLESTGSARRTKCQPWSTELIEAKVSDALPESKVDTFTFESTSYGIDSFAGSQPTAFATQQTLPSLGYVSIYSAYVKKCLSCAAYLNLLRGQGR